MRSGRGSSRDRVDLAGLDYPPRTRSTCSSPATSRTRCSGPRAPRRRTGRRRAPLRPMSRPSMPAWRPTPTCSRRPPAGTSATRRGPGRQAACGFGLLCLDRPLPLAVARAGRRPDRRRGRPRREARPGRPRDHRRGPDRRPDRVRQDRPRASPARAQAAGVPCICRRRRCRGGRRRRPGDRRCRGPAGPSPSRSRSPRRWPPARRRWSRCGERLAREAHVARGVTAAGSPAAR